MNWSVVVLLYNVTLMCIRKSIFFEIICKSNKHSCAWLRHISACNVSAACDCAQRTYAVPNE